MKLSFVSIVSTTKNEAEDVRNLLDSLMKIKYPKKKLEIIFVDDSTDDTPKIIKEYPVRIIRGKGKGNSAAKNLGWKKAKGDIVLFIDADIVLPPNYVKDVANCYKDDSVGGTAHFEKQLNKRPGYVARMLDLTKIFGAKGEPIFLKSCRKSILKKLGGFDPDFSYFDDRELGMRVKKAGYKTVWSKTKPLHMDMDSFSDLAKRYKWMGKSINFKRHKMVELKKLGFLSLCAGIPLYILFLFLQFPFWLLGTIGLILFISLELSRSLYLYYHSKDLESFSLPLFDYLTMSIAFLWFLDRILK